MRTDRLLPRPARAAILRLSVAGLVLASLTALAITVATTITETARAERAGRYAKDLTSRTVSGVDALSQLFRAQQDLYLRITPPTPDFVLRQPCGTIPFDPKAFPEAFLNGLVEETDKGCPVYTVVIAQDPTTRETVFANAKGYEVYAVAAAQNYNPWSFLESLYPDLYTGGYSSARIAELKSYYDPAHIQITVTLLPVEYIDSYATEMAATATFASGGSTPMMRYSGPPVTNLQFTAIETLTNGMLLTLAYPTDFTNRVDFFACTNLVDFWWDLAATTNVNTSTNWIEWLDTSPPGLRFYAAGNADLDTDGDSLTDAREKFMYHTSATTNDTDHDGLTDSNEVFNLHTDPNSNDVVCPVVTILFPANGSGKVWVP